MIPLTFEDYTARFGAELRPAEPFSLAMAEIGDTPLPRRKARTHKYSYGRAVLIAGCLGYAGAPALAANACERSGAGLTRLLIPESIYTVAAARCDGAVVTPLPGDSAGGFTPEACERALSAIESADACCVGPGLGTGEGAAALTDTVLRRGHAPLVLDADALSVCVREPELLAAYPSDVVLTPHEGEFRRIGGELKNGRLSGALAFTAAHPNVILVLKGHGTLICRGAEAVVNPTGTPAMAKGGSGDVLAGMITALLAQGFDSLFAVRCAVFLHGLAGEIACREKGEYCVAPSDLTAALPAAFRAVCEEGV